MKALMAMYSDAYMGSSVYAVGVLSVNCRIQNVDCRHKEAWSPLDIFLE